MDLTEALDAIDAAFAFVDPTLRHHAMLITEELVMNALTHGGAAVCTIDVVLSDDRSVAEISVFDDGLPFDASAMDNVKPMDLARIGGNGLRLIHELADTISYHCLNGHNQTKVTLK